MKKSKVTAASIVFLISYEVTDLVKNLMKSKTLFFIRIHMNQKLHSILKGL